MERDDSPTLDVLSMAARIAAGKDAVAKAFFQDMPEQVQDELLLGWKVYEERRRVRAEAGVPIAPGGVFVLGDRAVVAGVLADLHNSISQTLRTAPENVRLIPSEDGVGVEVRLPESWIPPGGKLPVGTLRRAAELFVKAVAEDADTQFKALRTLRLAAAHLIIADLIPTVEGW